MVRTGVGGPVGNLTSGFQITVTDSRREGRGHVLAAKAGGASSQAPELDLGTRPLSDAPSGAWGGSDESTPALDFTRSGTPMEYGGGGPGDLQGCKSLQTSSLWLNVFSVPNE